LLGRYYGEKTPGVIRADPLAGLGRRHASVEKTMTGSTDIFRGTYWE
jgi:hypothetical protein